MPGLNVAIGDTWQPRYISYFAMVMMGLMLITNVLNLKFVNIAGFSVIASLIPYVFSLILADVLSEVYGYRRVRRLLYIGLALLIVYAVCVQIAVMLPPAQGYTNNAAFVAVFSQAPRIVGASIAAYFVTELTASFVMSRLKIMAAARYFYGRALVSVGVAQIVNGVTFFTLAYAGEMTLKLILSAGAFSWTVVMICELFVLPATKRLAWTVKRLEGFEHFDSAPRGGQQRRAADRGVALTESDGSVEKG